MAPPYHAVTNLDLTADETAALARFLRSAIDDNRYPLSPRLAPLRTIFEKLEQPAPRPETRPPLKAYDAPSAKSRRSG
jgi:hypothetical protein